MPVVEIVVVVVAGMAVLVTVAGMAAVLVMVIDW